MTDEHKPELNKPTRHCYCRMCGQVWQHARIGEVLADVSYCGGCATEMYDDETYTRSDDDE
jgi:hypothetical protein